MVHILSEDGLTRFWAGIVRQAVDDYRAGWRKPGTPDADEFLRAAGLLSDDGTLDRRFAPAMTRQYVRKTMSQEEKQDELRDALRALWKGDDVSFDQQYPMLRSAWEQATKTQPKRDPMRTQIRL
jgi:hypothetical protein